MMCQVFRDNRLLVCGKAKSLPERHHKETYCIKAVRTCEELLPYVSLCIHPNGVSHTCVAFVYVSTSVHVCGVSVHVSVWLLRAEKYVCHSVSLLSAYSFETGSPTEPGTHHFNDAI